MAPPFDRPMLAVFCGSRAGVAPAYAEEAAAVGREIARAGAGLVFGGGRVGLMGILADAVLEEGGIAYGVIPAGLAAREVAHLGLTQLDIVNTMHERKSRMADVADGFLALPGGYGTLDEFFEIVTWRQLGHHARPIVLYNGSGFFDPLLAAMRRITDEGFARDGFDYFAVEKDPAAAVRRALAAAGQAFRRPRGRGPAVSRGLAACVAAVFLLLAATAEERTFGTVSDEQQMLYTAISIARTGRIGISRNQHFSIPRAGGDAVAPYGMGLPLVEVPFAALAGPWEARFGARTSQTLFVLLEVLLVTAAAAGAGLLAAALGAGLFGQGLAVFGTGLGSPLWAYTAFGFSEPLQAACLVFAFLFACLAARAEGGRAARLAATSGFFAGWLVLTKAVNLAFVPLLAPSAGRGRVASDARATSDVGRRGRGRRRAARRDARVRGRALRQAVLVLRGPEVRAPVPRRRLASPRRGEQGPAALFPARSRSPWPVSSSSRERGAPASPRSPSPRSPRRSSSSTPAGGHGTAAADGDRASSSLLVPALAAAAGTAAASRAGRAAGAALVALGIGVNALGTFESEAASFFYVSSTGLAPVSRALYAEYPASFRPPPRRERLVPALALRPGRVGRRVLRPQAPPLPISRARLADLGDDERRERLLRPPWLASHPHAVPDVPAFSPMITTRTPLVNYLTTPFRWPHLFMSFRASSRRTAGDVQPRVVRGNGGPGAPQPGRRPSGSRRPDRGRRSSRSCRRATWPRCVSRACVSRDRKRPRAPSSRSCRTASCARRRFCSCRRSGRATGARTRTPRLLLAEAARGIRTRPMLEAVGRPPSEWPRSFRELSSEITDGSDARLGAAPPR